MKHFTLASVLAVSTAFCAPLIASAHHGSNGQFDTAKNITVSGVITNIRMVNPHGYIYFDVTDESGKVNPWRAELSSGSLLNRNGWTKEKFASGQNVTINCSPARREEFGCMLKDITFDDGITIGRRDSIDAEGNSVPKPRVLTVKAKPNFAGTWVAEQRQRRARPGREAGGMGAPPGGAMGAPGGAMGGAGDANALLSMSTTYPMTKAGLAASKGFRRYDNPRFKCEATNLFHDWWFDQNVNEIEVLEDVVIIRYGFMDIVRTIHMDMKEHPKDLTPSRAGHSIGHWDGQDLVVDTIGFKQGYLQGGPQSVAMHSDALHIKERISMSKDGSRLSRSWELEDPKFLLKKHTGEDSVIYTQDSYQPYDCEDLTEEIVSGF